MEKLLLEPMSVTQILGKTLGLYRQNFLKYVALAAVVVVPLALAELPLRLAQLSALEQKQSWLGFSYGLCLLVLVAIGALGWVALVKHVSESCHGNDISVGQAYRSILPRVWSVIGVMFLVGWIVCVGCVLLIVPGILFYLWYSLVIQVVVLENMDAVPSLKRSKSLVSGNLGKVFLVTVVLFLPSLIINLVERWVGGIIAHDDARLWLWIPSLFALANGVLLTPIFVVAVTLLYYDLRIRKEGFDPGIQAVDLAAEGNVANAPPLP